MMGDEDLLESSVIIRRIIDKNGRSRAWINGVAAGASQLRELGEQLLDIHGQNARALHAGEGNAGCDGQGAEGCRHLQLQHFLLQR